MHAVGSDLRIRLEGHVELLERELEALRTLDEATRRRDYGRATLPPPTPTPPRLDLGLHERLAECRAVRARIIDRAARRADELGFPRAPLADRLRWLADEPVLYEHHRQPLRFWLLSPFLLSHVFAPTVLLALATHLPPLALLGPVIAFFISRALRSHVVVTSRRLVFEGTVLPRHGLTRVVVFSRNRAWSHRVECHYADGRREHARLRSLPSTLRATLRAAGIGVSETWDFFG